MLYFFIVCKSGIHNSLYHRSIQPLMVECTTMLTVLSVCLVLPCIY